MVPNYDVPILRHPDWDLSASLPDSSYHECLDIVGTGKTPMMKRTTRLVAQAMSRVGNISIASTAKPQL